MALPGIVSQSEWLEARLRLLAEEKELTRRRDPVNAQRRRLPMVRIDKDYMFDGVGGQATLAGLFGECRQLAVQHIMFDPDWDAACPRCTQFTSELTDALVMRIRSRDTAFAMICRAPLAKIEAHRAGRGWLVPWYSSYGSDFNYDFQVTLDPDLPQLHYNYRVETLPDGERSRELPGAGFFLRDRGQIFHTYSAYARGLDHLDAANSYLDLTALGRQEAWEVPKGHVPVVYDIM